MSKARFDVVPAQDGWVLRIPGDSVWELRPTKAEAIRRAQELGGRYDEWQIRVLAPSGEVESELSSVTPAAPS